MRVLVIGGTGQASSAVTQQLLDAGHAVATLNRGQTPVRYRGEVRRLLGDRGDPATVAHAVRADGPWDAVIDMVCGDPAHAAALREACRGQVAQVLFCSTTNVYPKPADSYPVGPEHRLGAAFASGVSKLACETVHRAAHAAGEYAVTIVRPGHILGETGRVLHSLGNGTAYLDRLRRGLPLVVHGDGTGLWTALHAEDVARVFVAATGHRAALGRAYNACGEQWFTWDQYQAAVAAALGVAVPPLVHIPPTALAKLAPERSAQVLRSLRYPGVYDMAATRHDLGVGQTIGLVEALGRTVAWLDQQGLIEPAASDANYDRVLAAWHAWATPWAPPA
jgi:nucleoside-diphosphate-sugar epimerase